MLTTKNFSSFVSLILRNHPGDQNTEVESSHSKYQKSRRTVTRTDYEVDFVEAFTRLVSNLAVFNEDAILTPRELNVVTLK